MSKVQYKSAMGYSCIGLVNPKTAANIGSIMRATGCFGAKSVMYSGERFKKARQFLTDPQKFHFHIPLLHVPDLHEVIPFDCAPVAVEFIDSAIPLPEYKHPHRAFYIFGPEDGSLGKNILSWCKDVIYIPTSHCLNLAATVNVVLYDRMTKIKKRSACQ